MTTKGSGDVCIAGMEDGVNLNFQAVKQLKLVDMPLSPKSNQLTKVISPVGKSEKEMGHNQRGYCSGAALIMVTLG